MNNKLTENNETLGVVIKPIFTIKDHQKNVTEEIRNESNQSTDSVAMNGTEIDLEVTEGIFNNKKKDNNAKEHKNFGKQEEQKIVSSKIEEEEEALKNAIEDQAREDERPLASNFTLKKILGGDIFSAHLLRNNIGLIVVVVLFIIIYISNRYSVQKDLIEIDRLQKELSDAKYRSLSSSSQLTERSRESHVLEILKTNKDSVLKISSRPPFIINVPTK
ncbi:FtsL-like putative cell division protein [Prevotella pallens]|uniref:FtsL-like putative cell division protein n=1 Tax=Prevotella pallens TaxID=60133 RepID=UPI0028E4A6FE|nr:FtsL-like putative cell division protein [Prevotella pallens]